MGKRSKVQIPPHVEIIATAGSTPSPSHFSWNLLASHKRFVNHFIVCNKCIVVDTA